MNYERLTDEMLLVEAVRRCRGRKLPRVVYTAYEKVAVTKVTEALERSMTPAAIRDAVNNLLEEGVVCVTCSLLTRKNNLFSFDAVKGLLRRCHPEVPLQRRQHFSAAGVPQDGKKSRVVPGSITLRVEGLYVVDDGLPAFVQKLLDTQHYIYPI